MDMRGRFLSADEVELAQALLNQTRNIDETARLLADSDEFERSDSFRQMQKALIRYIEKGWLII